MPYPLHEAIIKNNLSRVIELLRNGTINHNELNDQGFSLLQLAAKFGMLELSMWLLYAGAKIEVEHEFKHENNSILQESQKSPLYFAIENGYPLIAQVLLACGANQYKAMRLARKFQQVELEKHLQQLELRPSVIDALYYWSTINYNERYNTGLIKRLTPDFITNKDITIEIDEEIEHEQSEIKHISISAESKQEFTNQSALVNPWTAFAVQQGKSKLARELKAMGHPSSSSLRTPGYWAAMQNDDSTFEAMCTSDEDIAKTLLQLEADNTTIYNVFYNKVPLSAQEKYDASAELEQDVIPLSSNQRTLYKAAARNDKTNIVITYDNLKNLEARYETIKHAYNKKDAVALSNLLDIINKDFENILLHELTQANPNRDFFTFLFVATGQDTLKFSLFLFESHVNSLKNFMEIALDVKGLANQIIISIINNSNNNFLTKKRDLLFTLDLNEADKTNLILDKMQIQYPSQPFARLLNSPDLTLAKRIENLHVPLSLPFTRLLKEKFSLFNIAIKKNERDYSRPLLQNMAAAIWYTIYESYLDRVDQGALTVLSSDFHKIITKTGKKEQKLLKLQRQITLLTNFIDLTNQEMMKKNWFSHREIGKKEKELIWLSVFFLITITWLFLNLFFLIPYDTAKFYALKKDFDDECMSLCPGVGISLNHLVAKCDSGYCFGDCDKICKDIAFSTGGSLISVIMNSCAGGPFLAWLVYALIKYRAINQDRFNNVAIPDFFNKRVSQLKIYSAINSLVTEFRSDAVMADFENVDQFAGLSNQSTLGSFLTKCKSLKIELEFIKNTLNPEVETKDELALEEHKIEVTGNINEIKSNKPKGNGFLFSQFYNNSYYNILEDKETNQEEKIKNNDQENSPSSKNSLSKRSSESSELSRTHITKSQSWMSTIFGKTLLKNEKTPLLQSKSSMELGKQTYT